MQVGAWIEVDVIPKETEEIWAGVLDLGIDFFCTDYPLEFIAFRESYIKSIESVSEKT